MHSNLISLVSIPCNFTANKHGRVSLTLGYFTRFLEQNSFPYFGIKQATQLHESVI